MTLARSASIASSVASGSNVAAGKMQAAPETAAVIVPITVIVAVSVTDWISGLIVAITLPLIPLFGALVGLHTKARTRRQWRLLSQLSGHFLDVVAGLPTLKVFGRAKAQEQVIADVTCAHRSAAMATMRVAFLSALVLELSATLATALVAVETGLRLLYGHMSYPAALLVLLLTPEAYLPLRAAATQYHASAGVRPRWRACFASSRHRFPSRQQRDLSMHLRQRSPI